MKKPLLSLLFIASLATSGHAQIFSQNFSESTVVADYVDAAGFANNKFTGISNNTNAPSSITGGKLTFVKSGSSGGHFSQTADMNSQVLIIKFDFAVSRQVTSQTSALVFHVGNSLGNTGTVISPANGANTRFSINFDAISGAFSVRNIGSNTNATSTYSGEKTIIFAINNKSDEVSYTSPSGTERLPANTWDLWVGSDRAFNDAAVENRANTLANFKLTMQSSVPNATVTFDNFQIINENDATVLPVNLTSFTAKANLQNIDLAWSTASEESNSHFDILRSTNGVKFIKIDQIKGNGTSATAQNFTFTDKNALPGTSYYQLRQINFDGKIAISESLAVKSNVAATHFRVTSSAQDHTVKLIVFSANEGKALLKISDLNGRNVAEKEIDLNIGYTSHTLQLNTVKGLHIASLTTATETMVQKFMR